MFQKKVLRSTTNQHVTNLGGGVSQPTIWEYNIIQCHLKNGIPGLTGLGTTDLQGIAQAVQLTALFLLTLTGISLCHWEVQLQK